MPVGSMYRPPSQGAPEKAQTTQGGPPSGYGGSQGDWQNMQNYANWAQSRGPQQGAPTTQPEYGQMPAGLAKAVGGYYQPTHQIGYQPMGQMAGQLQGQLQAADQMYRYPQGNTGKVSNDQSGQADMNKYMSSLQAQMQGGPQSNTGKVSNDQAQAKEFNTRLGDAARGMRADRMGGPQMNDMMARMPQYMQQQGMGGQMQDMAHHMGGGSSGMMGNMQNMMARMQGGPQYGGMQEAMRGMMGGMGGGGYRSPSGNPFDQMLGGMQGNPFGQMQNMMGGMGGMGSMMGQMQNRMGQMPSTSWNLNGPGGQALFGNQNQYSYWPQGQMQNMARQMGGGGPFGGMNPQQTMGYFGGYGY